MTESSSGQPRHTDPSGEGPRDWTPDRERRGWLQRRRDKVIAEIERNRRGEYRVPTWVLAVLLIVVLGGWFALIFFG